MLILGPDQRGPALPLAGGPPRRPGSVRRTSTIDTTWPEGFLGPMASHGRARDLRTTAAGTDEVDSVELRLMVGRDRTVLEIDGPDPRLGRLVGSSTIRGFRAASRSALADLDESSSPLRLLVDDLPGALLVSGVAVLAADADEMMSDGGNLEHQIGVCAGWVPDGAMVTAARQHGQVPTPVTVECPPLDGGDRLAWHDAPLPEEVATRRRRLLDVSMGADGQLMVEALFRDSHVGPDGVERAFHEYAVHLVADAESATVTSIDAEAGVLPWHECPNALASADRLVGTTLADIRAQVRSSFRGTSTCTHLNDVLAAVGDAAVLATHLPT